MIKDDVVLTDSGINLDGCDAGDVEVRHAVHLYDVLLSGVQPVEHLGVVGQRADVLFLPLRQTLDGVAQQQLLDESLVWIIHPGDTDAGRGCTRPIHSELLRGQGIWPTNTPLIYKYMEYLGTL